MSGSRKKNRPLGEILIVDDEAFIRNAFRLYFETIGYQVHVADGGESALETFESAGSIDVVLLDLIMPGINGIEVLKSLKQRRPTVEVIIATGCGSLASAVVAMRNGAFDYITKPIVNFDEELLAVVEAALLRHRRPTQMSTVPETTEEARRDEQRLELFDRFVSLARFATCQDIRTENRPLKIGQTDSLTEMHKLLQDRLGIEAGLVVLRDESRELTTAHSWGSAVRVTFNSRWFSNKDLFKSVQKGELQTFTLEDLDTELLGVEASRGDLQPTALHVPMILEGRHRGALIVFFSKKKGEPSSFVLDDGNEFLVVVPLMASLFLSALGEQSSERRIPNAQHTIQRSEQTPGL